MTTEDKIDILTAENALLRNAIAHELAVGEKQIELLKSKGDKITPTERSFGSAIYRATERMKEVLGQVGAPSA